MNIVDFGKTKDKIAGTEAAKNAKRSEMKKLYKSLTENQEFLDILMIQVGKDIEEKFPGVKFRLISRIKTEKSFSDKLENDLAGLVEKKKIEEVKIYDIIALSIIIEEVPDNIVSNDASFDSHISELIRIRKDTKSNLEMHNSQILSYKKRIKILENKKQRKLESKAKNDEKIKEVSKIKKDILGIKEHLENISKSLEEDIADIDEQIKNKEEDIRNMETIISRTKERFDKESNECNHAMADFIIRNLTKFDNVKTLGVTEIPKRLKQKQNYDGYRAIHNCYEAQIKVKDEVGSDEYFHFICEMQGKSIDAFYVADRGKAAKYHSGLVQEPGKIVKDKNLPNMLDINTPEEIERFRKDVRKKVPRYRIYRKLKDKDKKGQTIHEVYRLSMKECFMLYYFNQLFGNTELGIEPQKRQLDDLVTESKLSDSDFQVYRNYHYNEIGEI